MKESIQPSRRINTITPGAFAQLLGSQRYARGVGKHASKHGRPHTQQTHRLRFQKNVEGGENKQSGLYSLTR